MSLASLPENTANMYCPYEGLLDNDRQSQNLSGAAFANFPRRHLFSFGALAASTAAECQTLTYHTNAKHVSNSLNQSVCVCVRTIQAPIWLAAHFCNLQGSSLLQPHVAWIALKQFAPHNSVRNDVSSVQISQTKWKWTNGLPNKTVALQCPFP